MHLCYALGTSDSQLAGLFLLRRAVERSMVDSTNRALESELRQSGPNCCKQTPRRSI